MSVPLARPYTIPLRSLYSKNIDNLLFAGRNASYTHIGLSSARVMATCGLAGQSAGVAAALAAIKNKTPREIQHSDITEVQQTLLRQGAYIPYCKNEDKSDLARVAKISASSETPLIVPDVSDENAKFKAPLFQLFPISENKLDFVEILILANKNIKFKASLRYARDIWDFSSTRDIAKVQAIALKDGKQWLRFDFKAKGLSQGFYWIIVESQNPNASWLATNEIVPGLVRGIWQTPESRMPELAPTYKTMRGTFVFRLSPDSYPFSADNIINGVARCERWTNMWMSKPIGKKSAEWIKLNWNKPKRISEIHIKFDGQFDSNIIWPEPLGVFGCQSLPAIVKQYEIQIQVDTEWKTIIFEDNNYHYMRVHKVSPVETDSLRVLIHKTNSVKQARIFEIRIY